MLTFQNVQRAEVFLTQTIDLVTEIPNAAEVVQLLNRAMTALHAIPNYKTAWKDAGVQIGQTFQQ